MMYLAVVKMARRKKLGSLFQNSFLGVLRLLVIFEITRIKRNKRFLFSKRLVSESFLLNLTRTNIALFSFLHQRALTVTLIRLTGIGNGSFVSILIYVCVFVQQRM